MYSDEYAGKFPVSVKGVIFVDSKVLLLRNERDEWELPGGKLEAGETPEACCGREILEETSLKVAVRCLVDAWVYRLGTNVRVLILTYGCDLAAENGRFAVSDEHKEGRWFAGDEIPAGRTPSGYIRSIDRWRAFWRPV